MRRWERRADPFDRVSETQRYLEAMVASPTNGTLAFVIILPPSASTANSNPAAEPITTPVDEGKLIGHAGIWQSHIEELVFMIDNSYWNQGYMTEVLETLIPIFWEHGLKMVCADVEPENGASLRLLRKMGFWQVGGNIIELAYKGRFETMRMVLRNPDAESEGEGKGEEEEEDDDDDG